MVRISIPTLPKRAATPPSALTLLPVREAGKHLGEFIKGGNGQTLIITGAGVSVDSGIRAYRGSEGSYSNPNYQPIFFGELVENSPKGEMFRKRYWARSFLGYPPVRNAQPNPNHIYIALMQSLGLAPSLITQNVDNLHRKALARVQAALNKGSTRTHTGHPVSVLPSGEYAKDHPHILELHGTLSRVHCMNKYHDQTRDAWQRLLADLNPIWEAESKEMEATGRLPRTNPDGDVELPGADYATFSVPECGACAAEGIEKSIVKPNVIFFGETLSKAVKDESFAHVANASRLLILGTSLATYSAFRLIKAAREQDKPVLMISEGPSRADPVPGVEKMEREAGPVLRAFLDDYLAEQEAQGSATVEAIKSVLDTGIVKRPPEKRSAAAKSEVIR